MNKLTFLLVLIGCLFTTIGKSQDSLSIYQKIDNQYEPIRTFIKDYYYNPANMSDYSNISFSSLELSNQKEKKQKYLLQEGSGFEGLLLEVNSFKRLDNNNNVWGSAAYNNKTMRDVQWNNNLDYKRLYPYVFADSTKRNNNYESYEFEGGYSKEYNQFNLGAKITYKAHMSYRNIDPRPKSVSSDIILNIGANYRILGDYKIGMFGELNKYIQSTDIKFASEIQQAMLYHITGLGTWNYYFSTRNPIAMYRGFGYKTGITLGNSKVKGFVITASIGNNKLNKDVMNSLSSKSDGFEINRLNTRLFSISAVKTFYLSDHILGFKVKYDNNVTKGVDVLYSNSENYLKKLLEKSRYKYDDYTTTTEILYQFKKNKFRLSAIPFFINKQTDESLKEVNSRQKFNYNYYGIKFNYLQEINNKNSFSILPYAVYRKVTQSQNKLNLTDTKESIKNWLLSDYDILESNYLCIGATLRYDFQIKKLPAFYTSINMEQTRFKEEKNNSYFCIALGTTF